MCKVVFQYSTLSLSLLTISASSTSAQDESWAARIAERYSASVVEIETQRLTESSSGSGFFVDSVGTFITNLHVVEGASIVRVRLATGEEFDALGFYNFDQGRDLILLRVSAIDVTPVELGTLSDVQPGDPVVAIGNPEGLTRSVTTGVVSAIREEEGTRRLQHSAPTTHGSSGGPLFDREGRVIGITTEAVAHGELDLNFAVPVEYVRGLLMAKGELRSFAELDEELRFAEVTSDKDDGSRPEGLTALYEVEVRGWSGYRRVKYAVLFEDPVGRITGGSLLTHRSGRYDVTVIHSGRTPAGVRDVAWREGNTQSSAFLMDDGRLSGEAYYTDGSFQFDATPIEFPWLAITGLYDVDVVAADSIRSRMSLALFQFSSSASSVYGIAHVWRNDEQGRVRRSILRFPRGDVGSDSVVLVAEDRTYRLTLAASWTEVRGQIHNEASGNTYKVVGQKRRDPPHLCVDAYRSIPVLADSAVRLQQKQDSLTRFIAALHITSTDLPNDSLRSLKARRDSLELMLRRSESETLAAEIKKVDAAFIEISREYTQPATRLKSRLQALQQAVQSDQEEAIDRLKRNRECLEARGRDPRLVWPGVESR